MCYCRGKNEKINRFHERCLRISNSDKKSTFTELLEKDNSVLVHQRNLRFIVIEMFKFKISLGPALCIEIIPKIKQNKYELRNNTDFTLRLVESVHKDQDNLSYLW